MDYLCFGQLDSAHPLLSICGFDRDSPGFENMAPLAKALRPAQAIGWITLIIMTFLKQTTNKLPSAFATASGEASFNRCYLTRYSLALCVDIII